MPEACGASRANLLATRPPTQSKLCNVLDVRLVSTSTCIHRRRADVRKLFTPGGAAAHLQVAHHLAVCGKGERWWLAAHGDAHRRACPIQIIHQLAKSRALWENKNASVAENHSRSSASK